MESKHLQKMKNVYAVLVNVAFYNHPFSEIEQHIGDDFMGYGTALDEILHGWEGFHWMITRQRGELNDDNKIEIKRIPVLNQLFGEDRSAFIVEEFEITVAMGQEFHGFTMRLSTILEYDNSRWMIKHFHGSTADADTPEGNAWPIEEWKRRNAELERVVAEKTIELSDRNKELEIEAALERVRARTMGMQKSADLHAVIQVVNEQMVSLDILVDHAGFIIDYKERDDMHIWLADPGGVPAEVMIPYFDSPHWNSFREAKKTGSEFFANHFSFEDKNSFYRQLFEFIPGLKEETKAQYLSCPGLAISTVLMENVGLYIENFSGTPYTADENDTLMRFGKVFQQTYTRFLDLQKAEALTRETQVELSLERIRSQAAAMKHPSDLLDVVVSMRTEFTSLGHEAGYFWHMRWLPEKYQKAMTSGDGSRIATVMELPRRIHGEIKVLAEWEKSDEPFVIFPMDVEATLDYVHKMGEWGDFERIDPNMPTEEDVRQMGGITYVMARTSLGEIGYSLVGYVERVPQPELDIFIRFAKAFNLAHKRFEDLKKSERQTRETQIELALEKVRSRTMAMQKSEELPEAANNLFLQVQDLGIPAWSAGYCIWTEDKKGSTACMSSEGVVQKPFVLPNVGVGYNFQEPLKKGETFHVQELGGELISEHYKFMRTLPIFGEIIDGIIEAGHPLPTFQIFHICYFKYGYVMFITYEPVPESHEIFKRFAKVFEQTYTRFLDLEKAEAQAREAQIEAALEKVRSRSLAVQKSYELKDVVAVLFEKLKELEIPSTAVGIAVNIEGSKDLNSFVCGENEDGLVITNYRLPYFNNKILKDICRVLENQIDYYVGHYSKKVKNSFYKYLLKHTTEFSHLPEDILSMIFDSPAYTISMVATKHAIFNINDFEGNILSENHKDVIVRFAKVFDQAYTRFLDLQKAEAQTREAQIEAALDRVRYQAMAMRKSEDLEACTRIVFEELEKLDLTIQRSGIGIFDAETKDCSLWTTVVNSEGKKELSTGITSLTIHPMLITTFDAWLVQESVSYVLEGQDLIDYYNIISEGNFYLSKEVISTSSSLPKEYYFYTPFVAGGLYFFTDTEPLQSDKDILRRFAEVFHMTYTRFLDLQKAESQAKEAQIEAALERVRAASMAMHRTDELSEVISILFKQFDVLGANPAFAHLTLFDGGEDHFTIRLTDTSGDRVVAEQKISLILVPVWVDSYNKWKNGDEHTLDVIRYTPKELPFVLSLLGDLIDAMPEKSKITAENYPNGLWTVQGHCKFGYLGLNIDRMPVDEDKEMVSRFAREFGRLYQRFLDLKKAEAQAREAQIETALERVRARALAMHESEEILDVAITLKKEMVKLGLAVTAATIYLKKDDGNIRVWDLTEVKEGDGGPKLSHIFEFKLEDTDPELWIRRVWNTKKDFGIVEMNKADYKRCEAWLRKHNPQTADGYVDFLKSINLKYSWHPTIPIANGRGRLSLDFIKEPPNEIKSILVRMGKTFDLAFQRFEDLKQAEAQAREAQIQLALERVRARTMAMQSSEELIDTSELLFQQIKELGIEVWSCGYSLWYDDDSYFIGYNPMPNGKMGPTFKIPLIENIFFKTIRKAKRAGKDFLIFESKGKSLAKTYDYMDKLPVVGEAMRGIVELGFELPKFQVTHCGFFSHGHLMFITLRHYPNAIDIFKRFTKEFEQTYTRFLDLQKAEEQAREAQIEAAIERVRSKSMAMHKSDELADLSFELVKQVQRLGVATWFCAFNIYDDNENGSLEWGSNADGTYEKYRTPRDGIFLQYYEAGQRGEDFLVNEIGENECPAHYDYLSSLPGVGEQLLKMKDAGIPFPTSQIDHVAFFKYGYILFITFEPEPESHDVFKRFAKVFEQTYTRFLDLQKAEVQAAIAKKQSQEIEKAYENLKATQAQLIQAEKMASLGELTAGIAHEIQNPLNFVNNFSEVSGELLDEVLEELEEGNTDDVKEIISDLKQNLEKIHHHGGRADSIVKGMLQHSRTNSGEKAPTNINELADEYLRLAYHGLRAKDNTFNATLETNFDENVGKINVIPQDIGRVLLNLITNAFQATHERSQNGNAHYKPKVTVSTCLTGQAATLTVQDNGSGIPDSIKDKIFQPFFTTKPTGKGTGLGLSLAYDIVKAHGGELRVKSEEGVGTTFIIELPVV